MPPKKSATASGAQASKKRARSPEKTTPATVAAIVKPAKRAKTSGDTSQKEPDVATEEEDDGSGEEGDSENEDGTEEENSDSESDEPNYAGTFDLYGMELEFLNKVYAPAGQKNVYPEGLFKTILTYQAENDRTAKITIPESYELGRQGKFRTGILRDPFEEMPFDIAVSEIKDVENTGFKSKYKAPTDRWDGPGIKATMAIEDGGCGISHSSGNVIMQPLWMGADADGNEVELFEGTFTFNVAYSSMYSRKGHGRGQNITLPFWAIRALGK